MAPFLSFSPSIKIQSNFMNENSLSHLYDAADIFKEIDFLKRIYDEAIAIFIWFYFIWCYWQPILKSLKNRGQFKNLGLNLKRSRIFILCIKFEAFFESYKMLPKTNWKHAFSWDCTTQFFFYEIQVIYHRIQILVRSNAVINYPWFNIPIWKVRQKHCHTHA